jgi:ElaB/YqjD/DUF883 family membrane-anchored ribosome-binding protein
MSAIGRFFTKMKQHPKTQTAKNWVKDNPWKTAGLGVAAVLTGGYFLFKPSSEESEGTMA